MAHIISLIRSYFMIIVNCKHFQLRRNTQFLREVLVLFGFFGHIGRLENYARRNSCWMKYSGHLSPVYFFSAHRSDQIWYACQMLFQLHFSLARFGPFWFIKHLVNWTKLNENDQIRIKIFYTIHWQENWVILIRKDIRFAGPIEYGIPR